MKRIGGSVFMVVLLLVVAIAGAAALAMGAVVLVQRSVGAHTEEGRALSAQDSPAPEAQNAPAGRPSPPTQTPARSAAERQQWANAKITQWLNTHAVDSIADLPEPYRHVEAWFAPGDGELHLLTTAADVSGDQDLAAIGRQVMGRLAPLDASLQAVTVATSDGSLRATTQR